MKPLLRRPGLSETDPSTMPWDRRLGASPRSSTLIDVARVPRLDSAGVCHHLPDRRRIRIDINGHFAGSPSCVPDAVNEFAVGWAFLNRFFYAPRELSKVTAVSHGVAIMVESGVDMDRRRHEAIGWTDNGEQDDFLLSTGPPLAPGSVHAGPMIDDLDLLSLCERGSATSIRRYARAMTWSASRGI